MKKPAALLAAAMAFAAGHADACSSLEEAMAKFEGVKNAYVAVAPTLKPEQFQVWSTHIQTFGDAMGKMDYPGACAALDTASVELGLTTAEAPSGGSGGGKAGSGGMGGGAAAVTPPATGGETASPPSSGETAATAPAASGGETVWQECPRGRCRDR